MPSNRLILCRPLLLPSIFASIRVFSDESALCIRWPKYWNFSFSISPSNEYSGLISFRVGWFDLAVQGTLKRLLQHQFESIGSSALSLLCTPAVTSIHDYWKIIILTIWTVGKVMSRFLIHLSRFFITIFPRSKQSPSALILEPLQKMKSDTVSTFSPSICHEVIGLDAMIFVF